MVQVLVHCHALGWHDQPYWQTLYVCSWQCDLGAHVTISCEGARVEFIHVDVDGRVAHAAHVATSDLAALHTEAAALVDFLVDGMEDADD